MLLTQALKNDILFQNPDGNIYPESEFGSYKCIDSESEVDGDELEDEKVFSPHLTSDVIRELWDQNDREMYLNKYDIDINDADDLLKLAKCVMKLNTGYGRAGGM